MVGVDGVLARLFSEALVTGLVDSARLLPDNSTIDDELPYKGAPRFDGEEVDSRWARLVKVLSSSAAVTRRGGPGGVLGGLGGVLGGGGGERRGSRGGGDGNGRNGGDGDFGGTMKSVSFDNSSRSCPCCPLCPPFGLRASVKSFLFLSLFLNRTSRSLSLLRSARERGIGAETGTGIVLRQTDGGCTKGLFAASARASVSVIKKGEGGNGGHSIKSFMFGGRVVSLGGDSSQDDCDDWEGVDDESSEPIEEAEDQDSLIGDRPLLAGEFSSSGNLP